MADCAGFSKSPTEYGRQVQFYTMEVLGNGSVVQRDMGKPKSRCRKWDLSVRIVENGVKRTTTRPFRGTYTNAVSAKKEFVAELRAMPEPDETDAGMTTPQWAREWHERRVKSMKLAESTLENDQYKIKLVDMHLDCPIVDVTADMIQDMYWKLAQGETPSGRPYKPKSLEGVHKAMVGMFGMAKKRGKIAANPMDDVECPKVEKESKDAIPSANVDYLLDYLDYSKPVQRVIAIIAACGLRLSEGTRADWDDVRDELIVRKSKTDAGIDRRIPVPPAVLSNLEPYRCKGTVGGGVKPASVRRWIERHGASFFVPNASPHDLRHSYCTRLAEAGVHPRVMMELMGHKSIDVCMEVYTHVNGVSRSQAIEMAFPNHQA